MEAALDLYRTAKRSKPTRTHNFIRLLQQNNKLCRLYTQNIDGLEEVAQLDRDPTRKSPSLVPLHGTVRYLVCRLCCAKYTWEGNEELVSRGEDLGCPECTATSQGRAARGERCTAVGLLRPAIVCSDEQHPRAEEIEHFVAQDKRRADLLLVLGTSLKFYGPLKVVKDLARAVHGRSGVVVYVNATEPRQEISDFADYWVDWRCDPWANHLLQRLQSNATKAKRRSGKSRPRRRLPPNRKGDIDGGVGTGLATAKRRKKALVPGDCTELPIVLQ